MKIAILSQDSSLYSTRRLRQAGEQRGHEIQIIDYLRCHISIVSDNPAIIYEGKPLGRFDAIIPRPWLLYCISCYWKGNCLSWQ